MTELLAPAGDIKSFDAALNCGADAIYLGLGNFNARMKAQNFDATTLSDAVKRAHFFGAKVYVTVNTILQNREFNSLLSLVKTAIDAKVDAFIVQDLGVVKLLRSCFDGIVLHASTQMGVHNLYGAKLLEEMGISRVVLSRETTLDDIKAIRRGTGLEIECFVQGALCVAFSGECYLSSVEQGASGNRGLCKQMCRLPYTAALGEVHKTGYLLSARDLCLADSIKELVEAGVTSFKIEGRMRREGYVARAVRVYRKILDGVEDNLSEEDKFALKTAFSRGEFLARGYLDGGTPSVIEPRFNNHCGARIGSVIDVRPFKKGLYEVDIASSHELKDGDGIKLFDGDVETASLGVGGVQSLKGGRYRFVTATKAVAGRQVNLTLDSAAEREALAAKRYNAIDMDVRALAGKPLKIVVRYEPAGYGDKTNVLVVEACSDSPLERAVNSPMSEEMIREQATKTLYGGFLVRRCEVKTDGVFVPKSVLNAVRRDVIAKAEAAAIACRETHVVRETLYRLPNFDKNAATPIGALNVIRPDDIKAGSVAVFDGDLVVLSPDDYTPQCVRQMTAELELDMSKVALALPALACGRDIETIESLLGELSKVKTVVANSLWGLYFARKGYSVIAGEGLNIANDLALEQAAELGARAAALSLEFKDGISESAGAKIYATRGAYPLMTLAHCPYKTVFGNDCAHCTYKKGLTLSRDDRTYAVRRVRVSRCEFELYAARKTPTRRP